MNQIAETAFQKFELKPCWKNMNQTKGSSWHVQTKIWKKKHDLKLTFTEIMGEMELILSYPQDARKHQVITFVEALQNASLGPLLVSVRGNMYIYIYKRM